MDEKPSVTPDSDEVVQSTYIKPQARKPYDPDVTFEEYHYYANKTRAEESTYEAPKFNWRDIAWGKKPEGVADTHLTEKDFTSESRLHISDEEWANASRAFRSASWGACFFLITTDILGPTSVGFTMGTLGWGAGVAFYTVFGFMGGYSGYLIWRVFMGVDSHQFPVKNYGDLGYRTWGKYGRHVTNILQAVSLLFLVSSVTLVFGLNISQVSKFRLCYAACPLIFAFCGLFFSQIRSLKAYGWVANVAVWLNVFMIIMTMGVMANSPPNFAISTLGSAGSAVDPSTITPDKHGNYPPIIHYNTIPPQGLIGAINGMLSGVLAYAGAQLFVEFMAEMRRPMDFIKAMCGAQFFIFALYLTYGCVVYYLQGQYAFNPSYQGVSTYGWQTVGNMVTLCAAFISGGLYGNIGIKVIYNNVFLDILGAPPLTTKRGKIFYACMVPIYWIIAFIIAAAIPDFFGLNSMISASMLLNLTYTIPPFFAMGFDIQKNAIRPQLGEGFDPLTGQVRRVGSTAQRWIRGFFSGGWLQVSFNIWHVLYFLASLSMCGLGCWAAIEGLITAFRNPQLNAFSCRSPLNLNA